MRRGGDRPPPIRPLPCRVRTWPWTAKRVLSATVLPEDIVAVIAHLSFEPTCTALLIQWQRCLFRKKAALHRDSFRLYNVLLISDGTSQFICDKPGVFFGKRFTRAYDNWDYDCCSSKARVGATLLRVWLNGMCSLLAPSLSPALRVCSRFCRRWWNVRRSERQASAQILKAWSVSVLCIFVIAV